MTFLKYFELFGISISIKEIFSGSESSSIYLPEGKLHSDKACSEIIKNNIDNRYFNKSAI